MRRALCGYSSLHKMEANQATITCARLTKETLEKGVKHVQR